jgi:hypothetical protein
LKARAPLLVAAILAAGLGASPAEATPEEGARRPHDAPLAAGSGASRPEAGVARRRAPELTPEYATIEEQGIKLVYHLLARERAHVLLGRALAIRAELTALLGREVLGAVEIRVAAMPAQMAALAPPELPAGAPAAAFRDLHLVVMSLGSPIPQETGDLEQHLRHELAHLALDEAVDGKDVPRWFHEGFAIHVSGEDASARAEALCVAALRDRLLGLRDVAARFPEGPASGSIAAAEAAELVRFLAASRGRFSALVGQLAEGPTCPDGSRDACPAATASFDRALSIAYEGTLDQIELGFRKELARRYSFVPVLLGATLLWVLVALGVTVRKRRLEAQRVASAGERRVLGAAARLLSRDPPAPHLPAEIDELAQAMPPEPEIPKVEHDGRWYTLH